MFAVLCVAGDVAGISIAKRLGARSTTELQLAGLFGAAWGAAIGMKIIFMLPDLSQSGTSDIDRPDYALNLPPSDQPDDRNPYSSPRDTSVHEKDQIRRNSATDKGGASQA
jgi:hypothetical protein